MKTLAKTLCWTLKQAKSMRNYNSSYKAMTRQTKIVKNVRLFAFSNRQEVSFAKRGVHDGCCWMINSVVCP